MRRWMAAPAALLVLVLTGCGSSQTSSSTQASTPSHSAGAPHGVAGCAASQLSLAYSGTQGATGHLELTLAERNLSRRPCRLRGYPGARLLGGSGQTLPLRVTRGRGFFSDTQSPPRSVVLRPGARAHVGIVLVTNNEYKGARVCRTATAAMLAVPSAEGRWQRVSLRGAPRIAPCGNRLVVSPIHA